MVFHRLLLTSKHILVSTVFISLAWQINRMASCELRLHKNTRRRQQCIGIIVFSFVLPFFSVSRRLAFGNAEWPFPLSAIRLAHVQSLMRHSAGWMVGQEVENTEKKNTDSLGSRLQTALFFGTVRFSQSICRLSQPVLSSSHFFPFKWDLHTEKKNQLCT